MNWEAIGAVGELVGAAAVFISLLYLATQIKDSRRSDQIVASATLSTTIDDWVRGLVQDKELCDLYVRGLTEYQLLDKSEKIRFSLLIYQFLRNVEAGWIQTNSGVIDKSYWLGVENSIVPIVGSEGGRRALDKHQHSLGPEFVAAVRDMLGDPSAPSDE